MIGGNALARGSRRLINAVAGKVVCNGLLQSLLDSLGYTVNVTFAVASQVDMIPTIMGRLGDDVQHQCWGRDLLTLPKGDSGFAVIKPSGSDQTVALIKNERIVIKPKDMDARVWTYQLGVNPHSAPARPDTNDAQLLQQLNAYIQTATASLLDNTAGALASPGE